METFNFPYHHPTHSYPKGDGFKFGRGYQFSAAPQEPVQRKFTLHFNTMIWFLNEDNTPDRVTEPEKNMQLLVDFYERHYTHKKFIYPHPTYGNITVKFDTDHPLEIPRSLKGGSGATDSFELVLIEQPL